MQSKSVVGVTDANFDLEVLGSKTPVLLDFFAPWCHPCHEISRLMDALADEYKDRVKIGRIDADSSRDLMQRFSIPTVPAILLFKDGVLISRQLGRKARREYVGMLESALNT